MKKTVLILATVLLVLVSAYALADTHTHNYVWKTTLYEHWKECTICGDIIYEEEHWGLYCDQGETHCHVCGVKESDGAVIEMYGHVYGSQTTFQISVTTHSFACDSCGQIITREHYAVCPNLGVCYVCGASEAKDGIVISETRSHNYVLKTNQYEHWEECTKCGDIMNKRDHYGYACVQGERHCWYCGAKTSEGAIITMYEHGFDSSQTSFEISVATHSAPCVICGQTVTEQHQAVCPNVGVCNRCGASVAEDGIVISKVLHSFKTGSATPYDANFHQYVCVTCGDLVLAEHLYIGDSKICRTCGFERPDPTDTPTTSPTDTPTPIPDFTPPPTDTPTSAPTVTPPDERYTAQATFDAQQKFLHGTVTLKEGAEELTRVFARITYFFADGTYTTGSVSVVDGEFEGMTSGNVIHVGIQIVDTYRVRPGEYNRFGATEFDVE